MDARSIRLRDVVIAGGGNNAMAAPIILNPVSQVDIFTAKRSLSTHLPSFVAEMGEAFSPHFSSDPITI